MDGFALEFIVAVDNVSGAHFLDHLSGEFVGLASRLPVLHGVKLIVRTYIKQTIPENPLTKCYSFILEMSSLVTLVCSTIPCLLVKVFRYMVS